MSALTWDNTGERLFETGTKKGVLYTAKEADPYGKATAWNGLIGVTEKPSGAEPTNLYADDIKYLALMSAETYDATIKAYMYPDEFKPCIGDVEVEPGVTIGQQSHEPFGFSYQTIIGNDTKSTAFGYKIHVVYGCLASPSEEDHETLNESPAASELSWDVSTTPVSITGHNPTATLEFDSTKLTPQQLKALEDTLYGTAEKEASLPLPDALINIVKTATV